MTSKKTFRSGTSGIPKRRRGDRDDNHQTRHDQRQSDQTNYDDADPARREFAADDIVLALKVAMKSKQQDQDRDA